jgi:hypothetical protein
MIYLLIFYWIFAALFCYGAVYAIAKVEKRNIFGVFLGCLVIGGILFPMYLGRNLHLEQYE